MRLVAWGVVPATERRSCLGGRSGAAVGRLDVAVGTAAATAPAAGAAAQGGLTEAGAKQGIPMYILRQAVWHVVEPQDPPASTHRREALRLSTLRGHVQAEGASVEAHMLGAPGRYNWPRELVRLLLLPDEL